MPRKTDKRHQLLLESSADPERRLDEPLRRLLDSLDSERSLDEALRRILDSVMSLDEPLPELLNYPQPIVWDRWYRGKADYYNDPRWPYDPRWPGSEQKIFNSSFDDLDEVDWFADEEADEEQSEGEAATQIHLSDVSRLRIRESYVNSLREWYSDIGEFPEEIKDLDSVLNKIPDKPQTLTLNEKSAGPWITLLVGAGAVGFLVGAGGFVLFIIMLLIAVWFSGIGKRKQLRIDVDAYNEARKAYWADKRKRIFRDSELARKAFQDDRHEWSETRNRRASVRQELDSAADASKFWTIVMDRVAMPSCFPRNHRSNLDSEGRVLVFDLFLPDLRSLQVVKDRELKRETKVVPANKTETRDAVSRIFFGYPLRVAYELAHTRFVEGADAIVVNSFVTRPDPRTGHERTDCIASVRCPIEDVKRIRIDQVDERASYRHFKGVFGGEPQDMVETAPLLTFSEEESRFVEGREIAEAAEGTNLAAMDWQDFEHLIRELFEKVYGSDGSEVRVTRASRDQGVDAIATNPDPFKGGKFIIQAKRYVNTVDVSAVRDLYGTVIQEGASRGILVTTSSFGSESHRFAEDKPLTLVNGDLLVQMLSKHGYDYFVDTKAARSLLNLD